MSEFLTREAEQIDGTRRLLVTLCVILATLMQSLDATIANVALPYMQGSLSASQDEINWVLTSYLVASAIMTAPTGFLAARFGRTRLFVLSITGFTVISVLCGTSQSLGEIVIYRSLQGAFGAALVPLSQAVMYDIYPLEQRGTAISVWTIGVMVGPILGPILGGWLTENYSWRWVFYINVPFGIFAGFGILAWLKEASFNRSAKLDWIGFCSLSLAIGAFQTLLDRGETLDWFSSPQILTEACLAGVGLYIFLVQFWLANSPFLSPRLLADKNFVIGSLLYFVNGLLMFATLSLLAPYLQIMMNYPVATAGLVLAPRGLGVMIAAILCSPLLKRLSPRFLIAGGFLISAYALHQTTCWTPDVSAQTIINIGIIQGFSLGFVAIPLNIVTFATLPVQLRTQGTSVYALMRNLGSAIGISVMSTLLQTNSQINNATLGAAITPFDRALQSGAALRLWDPDNVQGVTALSSEIWRQSNIIAYMDDFRLMFLLSVIAAPFVLFVKTGQRPKSIADDMPIIES